MAESSHRNGDCGRTAEEPLRQLLKTNRLSHQVLDTRGIKENTPVYVVQIKQYGQGIAAPGTLNKSMLSTKPYKGAPERERPVKVI